jgi:hypothetical protein
MTKRDKINLVEMTKWMVLDDSRVIWLSSAVEIELKVLHEPWCMIKVGHILRIGR